MKMRYSRKNKKMMNGVILTNLLLALALVFFSGNSLNAAGFNCQYLSDDKTKLIKFRFAIDSKPIFGAIVPIDVLNDDVKTDLKIKTVVIKDKPFVVLTDVQRINNEEDRMLLIYLYPERDRIKIINFNAGRNPSIGINNAKCSKIYE